MIRHSIRLLCFVATALVLSFASISHADVKLASIFGDGMVLQRELSVPVWGWAEAGEAVTVSFAGQTKSVTAGDDGKWTIKLDALKASADGASLKIAGKNSIELKDVLVGEVWICSGQSRHGSRISSCMRCLRQR